VEESPESGLGGDLGPSLENVDHDALLIDFSHRQHCLLLADRLVSLGYTRHGDLLLR